MQVLTPVMGEAAVSGKTVYDLYSALDALLLNREMDSIMITTGELEAPGPQIVFVNPTFTRMSGYAAEKVLGKTFRLLQGE